MSLVENAIQEAIKEADSDSEDRTATNSFEMTPPAATTGGPSESRTPVADPSNRSENRTEDRTKKDRKGCTRGCKKILMDAVGLNSKGKNNGFKSLIKGWTIYNVEDLYDFKIEDVKKEVIEKTEDFIHPDLAVKSKN